MKTGKEIFFGLALIAVSGCNEGKLALYARENAPPAAKFIENTVDGTVNLFTGQKNQPTKKLDRIQLEERYQLCEYSTTDFGKKWERGKD